MDGHTFGVTKGYTHSSPTGDSPDSIGITWGHTHPIGYSFGVTKGEPVRDSTGISIGRTLDGPQDSIGMTRGYTLDGSQLTKNGFTEIKNVNGTQYSDIVRKIRSLNAACKEEKLTVCRHPVNIGCRTGGSKMSFVGVRFINGQISAFGDSKTTLIRNGKKEEDLERGRVCKVFRNQYFVAACSGRNEFIRDRFGMEQCHMEGWMEENMPKFQYPDELCRKLSEGVFPGNVGSQWTENIIISFGRRITLGEDTVPVYGHAEISPGHYSYEEEYVKEPAAYYNGETAYVEFFHIFPDNLLLEDPDEQILEFEKVKDLLGEEHFKGRYDSVGSPFKIVCL